MSEFDLYYDKENRDLVFIGDELVIVDGVQNYMQQMQLRWLCERGELVHYPDYGTIIYSFGSKALSPSRLEEIKREASDVCMQDPRTEKVHDVQAVPEDQSLKLIVGLRGLGIEFSLEISFDYSSDMASADFRMEVTSGWG